MSCLAGEPMGGCRKGMSKAKKKVPIAVKEVAEVEEPTALLAAAA